MAVIKVVVVVVVGKTVRGGGVWRRPSTASADSAKVPSSVGSVAVLPPPSTHSPYSPPWPVLASQRRFRYVREGVEAAEDSLI